MCRVESRQPARSFEVRFEGTPHDSRVAPLEMSKVEALASVLSGALENEPNFKYLLPDEQTRRAVLPWFFRSIGIRACHLYGEIYTTESVEGGALWISRGQTLAFEQMVRIEIMTMPFELGWASFRRYINLGARVEAVRQRLVRGPHWYLMAHGVEPSKHQHAIGTALLEPVLSRADFLGLPCYLETTI
ncbi:MAG TPA: hypothetical protein VE422_27870 [Terriglobia bacterium]|nr:hypothetical protein [Terriglobia bacterium]